VKSKIVLSLIWAVGFGFMGCDRCYMDQLCLGTLKFVTGGGFMIWAIIDWFVIMVNMLQKLDNIDSMWFRAKFAKDEVDTAFYITAIFLVLQVVWGIFQASTVAAARAVAGASKD
jgi:hypothetical protein